ncbi:MAG TPA: FUSC family protein [Bauldia sp.]|nr:FUSC family protein [Bauldia sp.]
MRGSSAQSGARGLLGSLGDHIAASDPALSRLRLASRAMLSLALAALVLAAITWAVAPLPIAAYGMAVVICFVGSMAVRDPSGNAQIVTRAIGGLIAVATTLLATLLAPIPALADLTFLAVVFIAVYVRKYGPRWFAIGMVAFMAYFMGDYLRPQLGDAGWIALAVAIAMLATHVTGVFLLSDDPERDFRRAMIAIEHRINLILRELLPDGSDDKARAVPEKHLARLRDAVMMAEGFIPQGEKGALAAEGAASDLAIALFELQLALERLVAASHVEAPSAEAVHALLNRAVPMPGDDTAPATRLAARVGRALQRLEAALGPSPSPAFVPPAAAVPASGAVGPAAAPPARPAVPLDLQAPIQVTLACAIALGCGLLLSPVRWYWAVITAFIVFNNARSRADTALRALQRSVGTFAGLFVGTAAATLVHGSLWVSTIAILLLFFVGFYFVQVSYSLMIFLITIALALLYGVMGMFTPELLVVRLEETLVGGIAGALVAFFVFPTRTSVGAAMALEKYLTALGELVNAVKVRADGATAGADLAGLSRSVDRLYTELATTVRPIGGPWGVVTRFGEVREKLLFLAAAAHWGRVLARSLWPGRKLDAEMAQRIERAVEGVAVQISEARRRKEMYFERPRASETTLTARTPWPTATITNDDDPAFALEVIGALIGRASAS